MKLSPQEEAELLAALDEADREEGIPAEEFFARLRDQSLLAANDKWGAPVGPR